jgi:phosphoribosyl 1,2-cyclic phosphodiesterase
VKGRIWGSRGSIASPGQDTKRYGGNTSCIELRPPGCDVVILDAGTGIRELGVRLVREGAERMFLLLTHLHVDHLEGLGMFEPIWRKQTELHIWGPASPVASLEQRIATYFSPPLFPVHLSEVPATIEYHDASESEWQNYGARFF